LLNIRASEATGYHSLNGSLSVSLSLLLWVVLIVSLLSWFSPTVEEPDDAPDRARAPVGAAGVHPAHAGMQPRVHLPVSRANYAAPGKKTKRHRRPHRLVNYLIKHAK